MNDLLQLISKLLSSNWIPLIIAIIAAYVTLLQVRKNNITNARINWLQNLKDRISDFIKIIESIRIDNMFINDIQKLNDPAATNHKISIEKLQGLLDKKHELNKIYSLIILNLNPKEEVHNNFKDILNSIVNKIQRTDSGTPELKIELESLTKRLLSLARLILKIEWERTKRTEVKFMTKRKIKKLEEEALQI